MTSIQEPPKRAFQSQRLARIQPSLTAEATARMNAMKAEGRDIVVLTSGTPDFDTPEHIRQAAIAAMARGETRQTDVAGSIRLRQIVADKFKRDSALDYSLDEVMVSSGGKQIIFNALLATIDPGDEVIIPAPCWVSYPDIVALGEGRPVIVPCASENGFKLQAEQLEAAFTARTRWFILNNPCNPSGAVYSEAELRPLCAVLLRHPDVLILTDDIYENIVFTGRPAPTLAAVEPRLKDRTVTMSGCSKSYAMTGWRLGFCGAPAPLIKAMTKLQGQSTTSASSISQAAACAALSGPQDDIDDMVHSYRERRDLALGLIRRAPGLSCGEPEGAFYLFPSIAGCIGATTPAGRRIEDDVTFAEALVEEGGVGVVHGSAFLYPGHLRISYSVDIAALEEGFRRIVRFCEQLRAS
jgi:aspartate aminotransferase